MGNQTNKETEHRKEVPLEIERKWRLEHVPLILARYEAADIKQGYLIIAENGDELRVRSKHNIRSGSDEYTLTVKKGTGEVREEYEIEISEEKFNRLWAGIEGKGICKTRYEIPCPGYVIEIDFYSGHLKGLITAEVEFKSKEASRNFEPPLWFSEEVTRDPRYKNQSLSLYGIP